jgi:hypothetical protein
MPAKNRLHFFSSRSNLNRSVYPARDIRVRTGLLAHAAKNSSPAHDDSSVLIAADHGTSPADLATRLSLQLPAAELAAILVFVSAHYDAEAFAQAMADAFPTTPVYGCTTAGELAPSGLEDNSAVALGFRKSDFTIAARPILDLNGFDKDISDALSAGLQAEIAADNAQHPEAFGILLIDGLSARVETIVSMLSHSLTGLPVVGGSAADQLRFEKTWVICDAHAYQNAAILLLISTALPFVAFKCDQFEPTATKLVITEADRERRSVRELNAEPAAHEYAESFGMSEADLGIEAFALNPVVVKVGPDHYARSIRKADANGTLHFFSAIDEGLVLTGATRGDGLSALHELFRNTEAEIGIKERGSSPNSIARITSSASIPMANSFMPCI